MALIDWLSSYYNEDSSPNDSHSTRNLVDSNITYTSGALWNCAIFNGTNSKQSWSHGLWTGNINFSYYWWLYVTSSQTRWEFLSIGNQAALDQGIHFSRRTKSWWNDAIYFDYSVRAWSSTTARLNYNAWNFIWIRKSWSTISIRVNNNAFENFTAPSTLNVLTSTMIFWDYWLWTAYLNWRLDEIALFTTIKTDAEFDEAYNGGTPLAYPFTTSTNSAFFMFFQ